MNNHIEILTEFLNTPLKNGNDIFNRFASLPNSVIGKGENPLERFVFIQGDREDAVLLVAHIDTIWDDTYKKHKSEPRSVIFEDGVFKSDNPNCGLGADDRAGCAMLWALKNSGHSLLITDGEEFGKFGAKYLKKSHPKLFRQINRHSYIMEFDWCGTDSCLFNQVDNTKKFKNYIETKLGVTDSKKSGGTDIQILCKRICGVNIGVGYRNYHTNNEKLIYSDWENTYIKVSEFLKGHQPKFHLLFFPPYIRFVKLVIKKILRLLKLIK